MAWPCMWFVVPSYRHPRLPSGLAGGSQWSSRAAHCPRRGSDVRRHCPPSSHRLISGVLARTCSRDGPCGGRPVTCSNATPAPRQPSIRTMALDALPGTSPRPRRHQSARTRLLHTAIFHRSASAKHLVSSAGPGNASWPATPPRHCLATRPPPRLTRPSAHRSSTRALEPHQLAMCHAIHRNAPTPPALTPSAH